MESPQSLDLLVKLVEFVSGASPQQRSEIAVLLLTVSGAYPEHAKESWLTVGKMRKAIKSYNMADYFAARNADPDGSLASIVGIIYERHPIRDQENLARLKAWESSYTAKHTERLGNGT